MQLLSILMAPETELLNSARITIAIHLKATQMPCLFILALKRYSSFSLADTAGMPSFHLHAQNMYKMLL